MNAIRMNNAWIAYIRYIFHLFVLSMNYTHAMPNTNPNVWAPVKRYPVADP